MRGKHRQTGLGGRVLHTDHRTGPYTFGVWHYVAFDDGYQCWVPDAEFIEEVEMPVAVSAAPESPLLPIIDSPLWVTHIDKFIWCQKAGFPAEVTDALLSLIEDTDLLDAAYAAWKEWGDISGSFTEAVLQATGNECSFCEQCDELVWHDDSSKVANGDRVCESCLSDDYTKCFYCEQWHEDNKVTEVGCRNYCENCLHDHCYFCDGCDGWATECTTNVGERNYCDSCLRDGCSYCDDCGVWYEDDDDSHDHNDDDCDCEAPHRSFKFPADGHGLISQDERLTVELPKGTIDSHGMARIKHLLRDAVGWSHAHLVEVIVEDVGPLWQAKRGNFTRRLSSTFYSKARIKLPPDVISEVGNVARAHSSEGATWHVEFTRDLNQSADCFYHDESCWFQSYSYSRCALKSWGGIGMRSYCSTDTPTFSPSGRIWVQPLRQTGSARLVPTHDTENADAYVVFNGYGELSGYVAARIVAHLAGRSYRKIEFNADRMYINNDTGYLVADEALCLATDSIYISDDEHDQQDAYTYSKKEVAA